MMRNVRFGRSVMIALVMALWPASLLASAAVPAFARLTVYGAVEASYFVEARTGAYTAVGQGVAESGSLRAPVLAGPTTIRVRKANSRSAGFTLVISGGPEEIRIRSLSYDSAVTIDIPEAKRGSALVLSVLPE